jgi:hypothetical protein
MTICTYVLTNYVPAVAAIRKRLVLFIINRFKGYLDGKICLDWYDFSRVLCEKVVLMCEEIKFVDT